MSDHKLMPFAVFAGLLSIAVAVHTGLRSSAAPGATNLAQPSPDFSLPEQEARPWVAASANEDNARAPTLPAVYAATDQTPQEPGSAHTQGAFLTAWMPERAAAAKQCTAETGQGMPLEMPLELRITADGIITTARRFAQPRQVGADGAYHASAIADGAVDELANCYVQAISERVRFPLATASGQLKVWVPLAHTAG